MKTNEEGQDYDATERNHRICNVVDSGEVLRFHACPSVPCQTVAAHAWGVTVIASFIKKDPRPDLFMACLCHDQEELYTGDMPFTTKREIPGMQEMMAQAEQFYQDKHLFNIPRLTVAEKLVLKLSDMLEGMRYASLNERGYRIITERWFFTLSDMLCCEDMNQLDELECERAYKLFCTYTPLEHKVRTYASWEDMMQSFGNQERKRIKQNLALENQSKL